MKTLAILSLLLLANSIFAQNKLPEFLLGTWKSEDGTTFEHWDKLSSTSMKGYSYQLTEGKTKVTEYLEIAVRGKSTFYIPSVIGQNDGVPVEFKLTNNEKSYVFENAKHDFPKKIIYTEIAEGKVNVEVLGADDKGFSFVMINQEQAEMLEAMDQVFSETANPNYDAELAEKLAGDDYGMKHYMLVILKTGENKTTDKAYIDSCFMGHMANMDVMVKANQLVVAGPFGKNDKTFRGLFILNVTTVEEAQEILKTDPAVNAKLLAYDLVPWYGSAALATYLDNVDKIWRKKF